MKIYDVDNNVEREVVTIEYVLLPGNKSFKDLIGDELYARVTDESHSKAAFGLFLCDELKDRTGLSTMVMHMWPGETFRMIWHFADGASTTWTQEQWSDEWDTLEADALQTVLSQPDRWLV